MEAIFVYSGPPHRAAFGSGALKAPADAMDTLGLSVTSCVNAVAHAVAALSAKDHNPITTLMTADAGAEWREPAAHRSRFAPSGDRRDHHASGWARSARRSPPRLALQREETK
ncbi:MAG: hypothetical protein ABSA66_08725 [Roseiarcus sp.]|jgi:hypothetical protein